jgi:hypothetical protein
MTLWHEEMARAHHDSRMVEMQRQHEELRLAKARRLSRKAERAAHRARLALARSL